jgi:hypothetical protein
MDETVSKNDPFKKGYKGVFLAYFVRTNIFTSVG